MTAPLHHTTPLLPSRPLSLLSGHSVWLKMEALQPCGSFKLRGVGLACQTHHAHGARRLVSSSGGNAGLAVAYAGRQLGLPVSVFVPESTTARARELLAQEGATVTVHGASWAEANALALSQLDPAHDAFVHPFDDPLLWEGHASMIDEVNAAGVTPDVVVLSVGGGGLLSGVALGLQRQGWGQVPIVAVETDGAASFHAATQAGHAIALPAITSVATSLGATQVCEQAVQWWRERPIHSLQVSDASALRACQHFLRDHRVQVEPACGAALAVAYEHSDALNRLLARPADAASAARALPRPLNVLIIVCGGATATAAQVEQWLHAATQDSASPSVLAR